MADDGKSRPAAPDASTEDRGNPTTVTLPKKIGSYSIKHLLGSGGMGHVYVAQQESPRRVVALKVMKKGLASKSALRRFEYESQILGRLKHPNIAQVYEAGTHDDGEGGVPYFAMEYIANAKSIIEHAAAKNLGTRERLALFTKVCDAVHHGHMKGIIHRDLKPGNILVDSGGEPKIIDFGVARATDSDLAITTLQTDIGQLIGTLQYMSPEQCEGDPHDLDTRSDVYALGVVLYELLTDKLPYDVSHIAVYEAARVIREEQPTKPSTINKTLRGDVETITLKALEKDRERRYTSAEAFGEDIRRYLSDNPIAARPASAVYLLQRFARRHRTAVGGIAAVFVVLVLATIVSVVFLIQANTAKNSLTLEVIQRKNAEQRVSLLLVEAESARDEATQQAIIATVVKEFLIDDLIKSADPDLGGGSTMLLSDVLAQASLDVGDRFRNQPEVEAEIRLTLGIVLTKLAAYEDARNHLVHAIRLFRELHPNGSEREAESLHAYSLVYANGERDYPEALRIGLLAFEMFQRLVGDDDPRTQAVQGDLSWYEALASGKSAPGLDNQYVLAVLAKGLNTGESPEEIHDRYLRLLPKVDRLWREGQRDEAKRIIRAEAEAFLQHKYFRNYVPFSISSYALLLYQEGVLTNTAMAMAVTAVELGTEHLPNGHSKTLYAMTTLGRMYLDQQRFDEAETMFAPALKASRRTHGDDHPDTLVRMNDLAQLYFKVGRFVEAEPLLLEQYRRYAMASGTDTNEILLIMNNLVRLYESWNKPIEEKEWRDKLLLLTPTGK